MHVLGVGRRGRDLRVLVGRGDALLGDGRKVVAVDQVMRDAGVVRVLLVDRLEDLDGSQQRLHGLVVERLVQREGVEDLRLGVVRVLGGEPLHRLRVILRARVLVDLVVVLVELLERRQPVALALGLGPDGLTLLDRFEAALERGGVERSDERIRALADGDAPVGDGAVRVRGGDRREGLHRLGKEERVQHGQRPLELLLRLRRARSLEVHPPELLGLSGAVGRIGVRPPGCDESQRRDQCSQEASKEAHGVLLLSEEPGPPFEDMVAGILTHR